MTPFDSHQLDSIRAAAHPLGDDDEFTPLLDAIGHSRYVLLGEASHGTHEFYAARARITRRLIEEQDFTAVIVEADWPDAYRVNRFVRGTPDDPDTESALSGFIRFPTWMWRNHDVVDFLSWLRQHNDGLSPSALKCGFYGMDLYSLNTSIGEVLRYLERVDPQAAEKARRRYACFEHFGHDPQAYGYVAGFGLGKSCEDEVVNQLTEMIQHAKDYAKRDGRVAEDEYFFAEQNARLVKNAEEYYRSMFHGIDPSWNLRDTHMTDTVDALLAHLDRLGRRTKAVIWAHNSHLGDARATEAADRGEINVGQLLRQRHDGEVFSVGFTTHTGHVTAASDWDAPAEHKFVRPSLAESYERLFHDTRLPQFLLPLRDNAPVIAALDAPRLERAIGVIYRPETERQSHYFRARLPDQFDAILHYDRTRAVQPLELTATWRGAEVEETYPSAL
jgi:erythromycin esterase-like protein